MYRHRHERPTLFHLDADAFFAAVEQRERPHLAGRPVIVGGDPSGRGVVAAASYEARRYGIRSAMPVAQALRRAPHAVLLPVRRGLYARVSRELFGLAANYARQLETVSIDEAYLRPIPGEPHQVARELRAAVRRKLGLAVSIGIGPNKFLAKTATSLAKPDGMAHLGPADLPDLLWPRPLTAIHGVGEATAARWEVYGLKTVGDLAARDPAWVQRWLGDPGRVAWARAHGEDSRRLGDQPATRSVSRETTFPTDQRERQAVTVALAGLAEAVAVRLRRRGYRAATVTLKLRTGDYATRTHAVTPGRTFCDEITVWQLAHRLLTEHWRGEPLRLIGISLSGLVALDAPRQLMLLPFPDGAADGRGGTGPPARAPERDERLAGALDAIRRRHGRHAIRLAAAMTPRVRARASPAHRQGAGWPARSPSPHRPLPP